MKHAEIDKLRSEKVARQFMKDWVAEDPKNRTGVCQWDDGSNDSLSSLSGYIALISDNKAGFSYESFVQPEPEIAIREVFRMLVDNSKGSN